nr:rho-associated protein kinase 2 isoform X2 [Parasteatoda tepidariorum]
MLRIRREIQIMAVIRHPHIIHINEVFETRQKIVLVMQYASGGELYDYLRCHEKLPEEETRRVFRQIVSAIYYCHKNRICHRDIKLENILLDEEGNVQIADFGLSNIFDERRRMSTFCGSPLYASPEIVKGTPYKGPEVDCWSLGVLLYTLIYGTMPFDGRNFKELVAQISEGKYEEPVDRSRASSLIRSLLTPDISKRASIADVCKDTWVNDGHTDSLLKLAEQMASQNHLKEASKIYLEKISKNGFPLKTLPENRNGKTNLTSVLKNSTNISMDQKVCDKTNLYEQILSYDVRFVINKLLTAVESSLLEKETEKKKLTPKVWLRNGEIGTKIDSAYVIPIFEVTSVVPKLPSRINNFYQNKLSAKQNFDNCNSIDPLQKENTSIHKSSEKNHVNELHQENILPRVPTPKKKVETIKKINPFFQTKNHALTIARIFSMNFDKLHSSTRKLRERRQERSPGKVVIPTTFDPSYIENTVCEQKQIFIFPTISVSENKEKIEKKIDKIKKAALNMNLIVRSNSKNRLRIQKYLKSQAKKIQDLVFDEQRIINSKGRIRRSETVSDTCFEKRLINSLNNCQKINFLSSVKTSNHERHQSKEKYFLLEPDSLEIFSISRSRSEEIRFLDSFNEASTYENEIKLLKSYQIPNINNLHKISHDILNEKDNQENMEQNSQDNAEIAKQTKRVMDKLINIEQNSQRSAEILELTKRFMNKLSNMENSQENAEISELTKRVIDELSIMEENSRENAKILEKTKIVMNKLSNMEQNTQESAEILKLTKEFMNKLSNMEQNLEESAEISELTKRVIEKLSNIEQNSQVRVEILEITKTIMDKVSKIEQNSQESAKISELTKRAMDKLSNMEQIPQESAEVLELTKNVIDKLSNMEQNSQDNVEISELTKRVMDKLNNMEQNSQGSEEIFELTKRIVDQLNNIEQNSQYSAEISELTKIVMDKLSSKDSKQLCHKETSEIDESQNPIQEEFHISCSDLNELHLKITQNWMDLHDKPVTQNDKKLKRLASESSLTILKPDLRNKTPETKVGNHCCSEIQNKKKIKRRNTLGSITEDSISLKDRIKKDDFQNCLWMMYVNKKILNVREKNEFLSSPNIYNLSQYKGCLNNKSKSVDEINEAFYEAILSNTPAYELKEAKSAFLRKLLQKGSHNRKREISKSKTLDRRDPILKKKSSNGSFLQLMALKKIQEAEKELYKVDRNDYQEENSGSLLEALKTHGYKNVISQRFQTDNDDLFSFRHPMNSFTKRTLLKDIPKTYFSNFNTSLFNSPLDYGEYDELIEPASFHMDSSPKQFVQDWLTTDLSEKYFDTRKLERNVPIISEEETQMNNCNDRRFLSEGESSDSFNLSNINCMRTNDFNAVSENVSNHINGSGADQNYYFRTSSSINGTRTNDFNTASENISNHINGLGADQNYYYRPSSTLNGIRTNDFNTVSEDTSNHMNGSSADQNYYFRTSSTSDDEKEESVQDRIWRKSFYSRFNNSALSRKERSRYLDVGAQPERSSLYNGSFLTTLPRERSGSFQTIKNSSLKRAATLRPQRSREDSTDSENSFNVRSFKHTPIEP